MTLASRWFVPHPALQATRGTPERHGRNDLETNQMPPAARPGARAARAGTTGRPLLPEERKLQNDAAGMSLGTVCSWTR